MIRNLKSLSFLLMLGILLFTGSMNLAAGDGRLKIINDRVLYANGPSSKEIQQALAGTFPEWAAFTQAFERGEKTYVYDIGKVMRTASLAETFSLNPAITLVTLGVSLDWQLPPDGDLYSRAYAIGEKLDHFYMEYALDGRTQFPYFEVANAATYALYVFFDYDQTKLENWHRAYQDLFGLDSSLPPADTLEINLLEIEPFLQRPFRNSATSFYTVNSFFDHRYPRYDDEPKEDKRNLYRFDGVISEKDVAIDVCRLGINCYSGHDAYDYDTPRGTDILAAASGRVIDTDPAGLGSVVIEHDNGLATIYMHLDTIYVQEDDIVNVGDIIGEAGDVGTGGVHLHFGVRDSNDRTKDVDPFGWWDIFNSDPWEELPSGMKSLWLWQGDEAGDGYLTVDNRETQAQLFRHPYADGEWRRVGQGYRQEAWYAILDTTDDPDKTYWAIWGAYISTPGAYQVQAYWPSDPDPRNDPAPATKAVYTLYYHDPQGEVQSVRLYADQSRDANQFVTLCAVPYENDANGCPLYPQIYFGQGPSVVILRDASEEPVARGKYMVFFDAIRWQPISLETATPTVTPPNCPQATGAPPCTPTPTNTVVPPPTPTQACAVYGTGLQVSGNTVFFQLVNNSGAIYEIASFFINWPEPPDVTLLSAALDDGNGSVEYWNGFEPDPPVSVSSAAFIPPPSNYQLPPYQTRNNVFVFDDLLAATGYFIQVTFTNGCTVSISG